MTWKFLSRMRLRKEVELGRPKSRKEKRRGRRMYFCRENGELFLLEVMMRQAPGFRPRKSGIRVMHRNLTMDEVFGVKGKEKMRIRMERYEVPERIRKDVSGRSGEGELFRDGAHRERFMKVLAGPCQRQMQGNGRFLAAVYLLSCDDWLWERTKDQVTDLGILFDDVSVQGADAERKVLYHSAKEIYTGIQFISLEQMVDSKTVSDEVLSLIVSAYLLRVAGISLAKGVKK